MELMTNRPKARSTITRKLNQKPGRAWKIPSMPSEYEPFDNFVAAFASMVRWVLSPGSAKIFATQIAGKVLPDYVSLTGHTRSSQQIERQTHTHTHTAPLVVGKKMNRPKRFEKDPKKKRKKLNMEEITSSGNRRKEKRTQSRCFL